MAITLELPKEIEQQLQEEWNGDLSRKILEAVAVEGYRQGTLSRGQVSELLGLSFQDTEAFLKERKAYSPYSLQAVSHPPIHNGTQQIKTSQEQAKAYRAWAESHSRNTPLLSDEAISRESIYGERG